MANVNTRTQTVLNALNEQIADLEEKLAKYRPLLDELAQLKGARAVLTGEKAPPSRRGALDVEAVVDVMRASQGPLTPVEIATRTDADANTVRSHLNRNVASRYRKEGRGWVLVREDES